MAGFSVDKIPCIWTKPAGQTANPDRYLGRAHEQFIYAWKGNPIVVKRGRTNVFTYNTVPPDSKRHPTQRPIDLMVDILSTFTFPGEIILSPFLGSGTSLLAAYRNGNLCFGWDLSEEYKESFMIEVDEEIRNYHLLKDEE
jgi:site-specific DNA-methyltransferase (adenine-specific)